MDVNFFGIPLAVAAAAIIVPTAIRYVINSGLFRTPKVTKKTPPVRELTIMYKIGSGDYSLSGRLFKELSKLAPDKDLVGLYYDDPRTVPAAELRWAVGAILAEGTEDVDPSLEAKLKSAGFARHQLPCADLAVQAEWKIDTYLSMFLVYSRVYGAIVNYMEADKTWNVSNVCMEVYKGCSLTVLFILDHQEGFYVPGIKRQ